MIPMGSTSNLTEYNILRTDKQVGVNENCCGNCYFINRFNVKPNTMRT